MKKILSAVTLGLAAVVATAALTSPVQASPVQASPVQASSVQAETKKPKVHNVILVHGAFADGSGWQGVRDRLVAKGYKVSIVQEPETSLADDVAATRRVIAQQDGPVVLVGHSYGGVVITQAGDDPKVKSLVYAAASVPDAGETLGELLAKIPSPTNDVKPAGDGFLMIDPQKFHADFAADLPARQAQFMAESQVVISSSILEDKVSTAAWRTKPSYGIVAGADMVSAPDLERWMYKRANAKITEVPGSSHVVYISHPDKVAAVIEEAARR